MAATVPVGSRDRGAVGRCPVGRPSGTAPEQAPPVTTWPAPRSPGQEVTGATGRVQTSHSCLSRQLPPASAFTRGEEAVHVPPLRVPGLRRGHHAPHREAPHAPTSWDPVCRCHTGPVQRLLSCRTPTSPVPAVWPEAAAPRRSPGPAAQPGLQPTPRRGDAAGSGESFAAWSPW